MEFLNALLNDPVVISLSKTLLHFCWQGAFIAGILYLFLNSVDKKHAEARYLGAISAMGLFVAAPVLTFNYFFDVQVTSVDTALVTQVYLQEALGNIEQFDFETFLPFAAVFWFTGVLYLSARLCVEMFQVYKLPKVQVVPVEERVQQVFDGIAERLHIKRVVKVMASHKAEVPMVIGIVRPVILVPVSMISGLSTAQLEMLFAHELGHVKRHDFLVNLLQTMVEILFFFHPCVKWVSKQVRIEREYCCDDIAVDCCGNAHSYACTLAEAESIRKGAIPELIMAATGGDLKARVLRMVQTSDCSDNFSHSWHTLALAAVFAVSLAVFTFYAQDGLEARFADTLGRDIEDHPLIDEPEPAPLVEVAMEEVVETKVAPSQVDVFQEVELAANQQQLVASESLFLSSDQEAIQDRAPAELQEQVEPVEATIVAAQLPEQTFEVLDSADNVEVGLTLVVAASIEQQQPKSMDDPVNQQVVESLNEIEGFKQSPGALKVSLAKLNEKIESEGFALSIESDKIAMAIQPDTIDAPIIVAPRLLRSAPPKYPRMAVNKGIEADVVVSFTVNDRGRVEDLNFENKVQGYFKRSVRQALNAWRFEPGSIDGEIASMSMQKVFSFSDPENMAADAGAVKLTGTRIAKDI